MSKQKKSIWSEDIRSGLQQVNTTEIYDGKSIHDVNNNTNTGGIFILRRYKIEQEKEIVKENCYIAKAFHGIQPLVNMPLKKTKIILSRSELNFPNKDIFIRDFVPTGAGT